jgi:hypothetical protein
MGQTLKLTNFSGEHVVFSRKESARKILGLVTDDPERSAAGLIQMYEHRWAVELFFQDSKPLLGLGQYQNRSYGAAVTQLPPDVGTGRDVLSNDSQIAQRSRLCWVIHSGWIITHSECVAQCTNDHLPRLREARPTCSWTYEFTKVPVPSHFVMGEPKRL